MFHFKFFSLITLLTLTLTFQDLCWSSNEKEKEREEPPARTLATPQDDLQELSREIGYTFNKPALLQFALRHSLTDIGHSPSSRGYERLEFLGDAVLEHLMRVYLWETFPQLDANELCKYCSDLTNNETLSHLSKHLKLAARSKNLKLSKISKEEKLSPHRQADFVEALIGAIYIDGGIQASRAFIMRYWTSEKAPRPIFKVMSSISRQSFGDNSLASLLTHSLHKHLFHAPQQINHLEFLGEGILRFVLRDLLYHRFHECIEGELDQKYKKFISNKTLFEMTESYGLTQHLREYTLKSFLGLLYLDSGFGPAQDFILWHWTGDKAPAVVIEAMEKKINTLPSIESEIFTILPPYPLTSPSSKNLLHDLLLMRGDKPIYTCEKIGEDHKPTFKITLQSPSGLFEDMQAESAKLIDGEKKAAQKAIDNLSAKVLIAVIENKKNLFVDQSSINFAIKLLEAKLAYLGIGEFNYYTLAKYSYLGQNNCRLEIQGKKLYPTLGEGETLEMAQLQALGKGLIKLIGIEYRKIAERVQGRSDAAPLEESYLLFFKNFCEEKLKSLGYREFAYEAVSKGPEKSMPILRFEIKVEGLRPAQGQGFTPLQAQLSALMSLLDSITGVGTSS